MRGREAGRNTRVWSGDGFGASNDDSRVLAGDDSLIVEVCEGNSGTVIALSSSSSSSASQDCILQELGLLFLPQEFLVLFLQLTLSLSLSL